MRLLAISGLPATSLKGLRLAEVARKFQHIIDPAELSFHRVCGKVVKTNANTGAANPVPFATVLVEDKDCSYLGFSPPVTHAADTSRSVTAAR